ncbi:hypothetical protein QAD02_014237 [Eretmocerus hayati]|uniref:Uncharacterized protein n=1 Tax=Eretmocerus hayati TaxID=131215 RepID=A0ACC2P9J5_9HYME|nr:hypothetical protein QAD02_014237 [Eretmocerus hayati]
MDDEDENFLMDNGVDIFDIGDGILLGYRNRLPKRYVRDAQNPFEWYRGSEFTGRYGFLKDAVMNVILPLIRVRLDHWNNRGLPVPAQLQVLMGLRFYRTGYFAIDVLAAVGLRGEFLHVDVRNPGLVHDQTCLDRSALRRIFEDGLVEGMN